MVRRLFWRGLKKAWHDSQKRAESLGAVLIVDIDHFKALNDRHGHAAGDHVLVQLTNQLSASVRPCDLVARIGGEEFAVVLHSDDLTSATAAAERLCRETANRPVRVNDHELSLTVSIGVACFDRTDATHEAVVLRADQALYQAKDGGRNQVCTQ